MGRAEEGREGPWTICCHKCCNVKEGEEACNILWPSSLYSRTILPFFDLPEQVRTLHLAKVLGVLGQIRGRCLVSTYFIFSHIHIVESNASLKTASELHGQHRLTTKCLLGIHTAMLYYTLGTAEDLSIQHRTHPLLSTWTILAILW